MVFFFFPPAVFPPQVWFVWRNVEAAALERPLSLKDWVQGFNFQRVCRCFSWSTRRMSSWIVWRSHITGIFFSLQYKCSNNCICRKRLYEAVAMAESMWRPFTSQFRLINNRLNELSLSAPALTRLKIQTWSRITYLSQSCKFLKSHCLTKIQILQN